MSSLLYANDAPGKHAESYYAASTKLMPLHPRFEGAQKCDVAIIGAGYTGLNAALALAKTGRKVVVLDAQRAGWGASGRNGGQLGSGQRVEQPELEAQFGKPQARALWDLGEAAKTHVKSLIATHAIACDLKSGIAHVNHRKRFDDEAKALADHMGETYDYPLRYLPPNETRALVGSPRYSGGVLDEAAGHLHPLKYALGLAKAAEEAGAIIFERSQVTRIDAANKYVFTARGQLRAKTIVLATNGYLGALEPEVAARVMPINNFVIATAPLADDLRASVLARDIAVADSKFVVNYFRFSADGRLLFGGRESYGYRFPRDIKGFVRKAMVGIFPQLRDVAVDFGWGGTLAITRSRLPYLRQIQPGIWNASGYSGHGVAMASYSGKMIADAICGHEDGFATMAALPHGTFPGGANARTPLLVAAMLWYGLRDRF